MITTTCSTAGGRVGEGARRRAEDFNERTMIEQLQDLYTGLAWASG